MDTVKKHRITGLAIAVLIFVVDQVVKYIVAVPLALGSRGGESIEILPFFQLTWARNYGVSMGMLTASSETQRWLLVALTAVIAAVVLIWMWRERTKGDIWALALVLGGALGNIVDRATLGYVIDYADLHIGEFRPFLIFNIADAAITIGVVLLLARVLFIGKKDAKSAGKTGNKDSLETHDA